MSSSSTLGRLRWYLWQLFNLVIDRTITTQPLFSGICKEAGTHAIFKMHNLFKSNIIIYFQIQYGGCVIWDCWSENASSRIKLRRSQITKTTGHLGVQVDIDIRSNTRTKLRAWLQKIEIESLMYPSILLIFTIYYFYLGLCAIVPPWALGPSLSGRNNSKKS